MHSLEQRKARQSDLTQIVALLRQDEMGAARESSDQAWSDCYEQAFHAIDQDPNHYLMVVEQDHCIVATCHLTLLPSLTFKGMCRLLVEAVRVHQDHRNQGVGQWMIKAAIAYGREHGVGMVQLTTHKMRADALRFYESLGFVASHEGMKCML